MRRPCRSSSTGLPRSRNKTGCATSNCHCQHSTPTLMLDSQRVTNLADAHPHPLYSGRSRLPRLNPRAGFQFSPFYPRPPPPPPTSSAQHPPPPPHCLKLFLPLPPPP